MTLPAKTLRGPSTWQPTASTRGKPAGGKDMSEDCWRARAALQRFHCAEEVRVTLSERGNRELWVSIHPL